MAFTVDSAPSVIESPRVTTVPATRGGGSTSTPSANIQQLIVVLKPLLFDPVLKVFALREERTEGARATARELQEKAGELLQRYEKELERVKQVAADERDILRSETTKLKAEILGEAREATTRIMSAAADARALIIDLRANGGGSPFAVASAA